MSNNDNPFQLGHSQDPILAINDSIRPGSQQQQQQSKRKKKSRGNRKLQRFRAKLKKQGLNAETIETIIDRYNEPVQQHPSRRLTEALDTNINVEELIEINQSERRYADEDIRTTTTKRKRETRPAGVTTSISQVSIAPPIEKRRSRSVAPVVTTTSIVLSNAVEAKNNQSDMKPNYLNTPDNVFKKMLSTALEGAENIIDLVDTSQKLKYARQYAQLVNDLFYLKLKREFWAHYYKLAINAGIWSMKLSKQFMKENKLDQIQFITQKNVEKYQQTTAELLNLAEVKLNQHKQLELGQSMDLQRLSTVIPAFVRKGQHKLSADFKRKISKLQFDINDYIFVQAFYALQPSQDEIVAAKIIWQASIAKQQAEEYLAVLKKRLYIKRLPASYNVLDHSIDNIEKMVQNIALNEDECASILSRRQKMIAQFKYDLILLEISTNEQIARNHATMIACEKKRLIDSAGGQNTLPKPMVSILNGISARQSNIIKRAELITKHKVSFFDEAPVVTEEIQAAGTTIGATL
ncbi:unnamed protein product [Adineta ricciae]|uniref:Uncharacterized protein n=1 Tax=Adineta ricciae TaxID=249248 RepID=A0A815VHG4_ADIRI|nr:unnamed protein product [Adineta ricciae]